MTRAVHMLQVAGPTGAVFRVTDGASRCVGTGMHRLDLQLPQGIYTVSASLGRSIETREVLLDEPQSIELQSSHQSFGDRAFALAPGVLAAIGPQLGRPGGGQLITLRGPWRDEEAAADRVTLGRDGVVVPARREGFLPDPDGWGVWSWQLFELALQAASSAAGASGVLTVTRSVCEPAEHDPLAPDASSPGLPPKVSHVLPHWANWTVWAVYPATACGTPGGLEMPPAYYVRMRLALPGTTPPAALQSLHDQVFTALAARNGLPLSKPVLDLLLSDEADPLLTVAAAHLASITLGALGRFRPLPHDASAPASASGLPPGAVPPELQLIDADALQERFTAWLAQQGGGPLAGSADMVAARFLFGIPTPAHLRVPPVLLRSLDGLIAATESPEARAIGTRCEEGVWGARLQISDAFAFLQWNPEIDYQQELLTSVKRSLESVQASVRFIEKAKAQAERQSKAERTRLEAAPPTKRSASKAQAGRAAPRSASAPLPAKRTATRAQPKAPALDVEAFIKSNVASLRIPASAMTQLGTVLSSLSIDQKVIAQTLKLLAPRQKD